MLRKDCTKRLTCRLGYSEAPWRTVFPSWLFSPVPTGVCLLLHFRSSRFIPSLESLLLHTRKNCAYRFPLLEVNAFCSTCPHQAGCCVDQNSGEACTGTCHLFCISSDCWLHCEMLIKFSTFYLKHALSKPALHLVLLTVHFHHQITWKMSFSFGIYNYF